MTFKHINFDDSPVMRSLERMTISKEPQKQLIIEKTASSNKPDFTPTGDFFSNLTKLCSGLRDAGLSKYADELENNYLRYKQAETAYETSKETGEDLVDQAHPQGSVRVGDSEYGEIETIVDQQLRTLKIIDKNPTGKLTSAADIIRAVKVSLSADEVDEESELAELKRYKDLQVLRRKAAINKLRKIRVTINTIQEYVTTYFGGSLTYKPNMNSHIQDINNILENIAQSTDAKSEIKKVIGELNGMINSTEFFDWKDLWMFTGLPGPALIRHVGDFADIAGLSDSGYQNDKREIILGKIKKCVDIANTAMALITGKLDSQIGAHTSEPATSEPTTSEPTTSEPTTSDSVSKNESNVFPNLESNFNAVMWKCNSLLSKIQASDHKTAKQESISYITNIVSKISSLKKDYDLFKQESYIKGANIVKNKLQNYSNSIKKLESRWSPYL